MEKFLMPAVFALLVGSTSMAVAQEIKVFTGPPLKKGVLYMPSSIAVFLALKVENNCVYAHSANGITRAVDKEKMLPVFVDGSKLKGNNAILIREYEYGERYTYTPMNKVLMFSANFGGRLAVPYERKKYASCMKGVNKIIYIYSGGSNFKFPVVPKDLGDLLIKP